MDERTWATIDLDKLRANAKKIRGLVGNNIKILAVVKANAYGHGAKEVSETLKEENIDFLGVASVDEAYELKTTGLPIIILSPIPTNNITHIIKNNFIPTVNEYSFATMLNKEADKKLKIHIEIDTGMNRTGIPYKSAIHFIKKIKELKNIEIEGIWTHLSEPENKNSSFTTEQIEKFNYIIKELNKINIFIPYFHVSSSAALLNFTNLYFNMVRIGILFYGMYPSDKCDKKIEVEPILNLYTKICEIRKINKGDAVSYGRTYIADRERTIATLCVGYGDGYPRSLSNKGYVIIHNKKANIVGSVCMDLTMVDVSHIPNVNIGDKVTLIGDGISASHLSELAGTVNYEITTRISTRVPRLYIKNHKLQKISSLITSEA